MSLRGKASPVLMSFIRVIDVARAIYGLTTLPFSNEASRIDRAHTALDRTHCSFAIVKLKDCAGLC